MTTTTTQYAINGQNRTETVTTHSAWSNFYFDLDTARHTIHGTTYAISSIEIETTWLSTKPAPAFDGSFDEPSFTIHTYSVRTNGKTGDKYKKFCFSAKHLFQVSDFPVELIEALKEDLLSQIAKAVA